MVENIDAAFDDAYRCVRIEAGDSPSTLPDPYERSSHASSSRDLIGAGGFMIDDDDAGDGFLYSDQESDQEESRSEGGGGGGGGGFFFDQEKESSSSVQPTQISEPPKTIPLSSIPTALVNLGLSPNDVTVLSLFEDTAYYPVESRRKGNGVEKVIGREEFRQVVQVLLEEREQKVNQEIKLSSRRRNRQRPTRQAAIQSRTSLRKIQDVVEEEDDESDGDSDSVDTNPNLSSEYDSDNHGPRRRRRRRTGAQNGKRTRQSRSDDDEQQDQDQEEEEDVGKLERKRTKPNHYNNNKSNTVPRLNRDQREQVLTAFELLLERLPSHSTLDSIPTTMRRIGASEIKLIFESVGEKITDKEVQEMLEEGSKWFAPASSSNATRESCQNARAAAQGALIAAGIQGPTVGLDEFAGILVKAKMI